MQQIAQRTSFSACLSIPTLEEKAWRATEPHTPSPRARIEAVAELNRSGIPTGVLIAPLMPGINDAPEQVEPLLEAVREAGATHIGGVALHLRAGVREVFMDWLRSARPDLVSRYEQLYRRGAYAPQNERERLAGMVRWREWPASFRGGRAPDRTPPSPPPAPPAPRQQALF
jgi:DNA repair photolyase